MAEIDNDLLAFLLLEELYKKGIIKDSEIKKIREQKDEYIANKLKSKRR